MISTKSKSHPTKSKRNHQVPEQMLKVHGYWLFIINNILKNNKNYLIISQYDSDEILETIIADIKSLYEFTHKYHTEYTHLARCITMENNISTKINKYISTLKIKSTTKVKIFFIFTLLNLMLLDIKISAHRAFTNNKYESYRDDIDALYQKYDSLIENINRSFFKDIDEYHPDIHSNDRRIQLKTYCDIDVRIIIDQCLFDITEMMIQDGLHLFPILSYNTTPIPTIEEIKDKIVTWLSSRGKTIDDIRTDLPITLSGYIQFN